MRIMVVDDEKDICDVVSMMLGDRAECLSAQSGEAAIQTLTDAWEEGETIDCIFLDLLMPGMDGMTVLKKIRVLELERVNQGLTAVKIIILTATNTPKTIVKAFTEQSDGYIIKPFDEERLVTEMKKLGLPV